MAYQGLIEIAKLIGVFDCHSKFTCAYSRHCHFYFDTAEDRQRFVDIVVLLEQFKITSLGKADA